MCMGGGVQGAPPPLFSGHPHRDASPSRSNEHCLAPWPKAKGLWGEQIVLCEHGVKPEVEITRKGGQPRRPSGIAATEAVLVLRPRKATQMRSITDKGMRP